MRNNHFTSLNPKDELFKKLKGNNPIWWQFVKENIKPGGFYVDIRKDNSLNVYYNGGSLLRITFSKGTIKGKIHQSYLGIAGSKYVYYELDRLPMDIDEIKKRIVSKYGDTSENGIKAKLICDPNAKYIDSEFAYSEIIVKKKSRYGKEVDAYLTTRIDLTKLENGRIVFIELKRIEDGRLLTDEYENGEPEILSQIKVYNQFIKAHKEEITNYYKKLFSIKHDLGILPKRLTGIDNIDDYVLCEGVELYVESYSSRNPRRIRRINAIKAILDRNNIIHNL
ncbi:hypothetical protein FQ707_07395 [Bacteroidaceae bacterium HV4-6-C5C]|nr:hypothetical protein FQ707_07395 [Bacteroidaceae bacterium HV4-6-C5C]